MKRTLTILSVALVALTLSSCVEKSKKYQQLMAEKNAVVLENQKIEKEYIMLLSALSAMLKTILVQFAMQKA